MSAPAPSDVNTSSQSNSASNEHSSREKSSSGTGKTKAEKVMTAQFALQPCFENIARRPAYLPDPKDFDGNIVELDVISNSFRVRIAENFSCDIIKYDVLFDPPLQEDAKIREEILMDLEADIKERTGDHALDNARLYCWQPLQDQRDEIKWNPEELVAIDYAGNAPYEGKVTLKAGQRKDLAELDNQFQSQICSVFLRQLCRRLEFTRMGRNHYDPKSESRQVDMSAVRNYTGSLLFMDGFRMSLEYTSYIDRANASIVPTISLTIDACSRVLEERTVQDVIDEIGNASQNFGQKKKNIIAEIKGRAVLTDYNNKIFKIDSVEFNASPKKKKMWHAPNNETPKEITVKEYYMQQYKIDTSDYDDYKILLVHDLSPRVRDAGKTRKLYIIPALCHLTGYPAKIRRNHMLMKKISRANKLPSRIRCEKVIKCAERLSQAASSSDSPLQITAQIDVIQGRMIAPAPMYLAQKGKGAPKEIEINSLQANWKKFGMFDQKKLEDKKWAVVYGRKVEKKIDKMVRAMQTQTKPMGKDILGEPVRVKVDKEENTKLWDELITNAIEKHKLTAVVVVIPCSRQPGFDEKQNADLIYGTVKRVCSKEQGVASQCIQSCNIDTSHVIVGITRQLFTKLGSIPWKLKFALLGKALDLCKPTMLVGIDVNHDRKSPVSPVAFVSSWDRDFVRYHSQLRYHKLADEVMNSEEMCQFMSSALKNFKSKNRIFPSQVIVYRDGIASTQIEHVDKHELQGISTAFKNLGVKPKLEFILVNKRVNSRFVHEKTYQNVPKGLVVDDKVVSSQYWDFYLTPADAPEGCTSTPTRFIVIRDGLSLRQKKGSLQLEAFTKQLCNLYFNWPGPVRVPSCVKNADKLTTQFGSAVNGEVPHSLLQNTYHFL